MKKDVIGKVKWFNDSKGFGYVNCTNEGIEAFVHYSAIAGEGFKTLAEGQDILVDLAETPKGWQCENVRKIVFQK